MADEARSPETETEQPSTSVCKYLLRGLARAAIGLGGISTRSGGGGGLQSTRGPVAMQLLIFGVFLEEGGRSWTTVGNMIWAPSTKKIRVCDMQNAVCPASVPHGTTQYQVPEILLVHKDQERFAVSNRQTKRLACDFSSHTRASPNIPTNSCWV